ncbi:hypothetical protein AB672_04215 [Xylella taiwanensis]|nr:hypothetical protein AB672_04215 [Xylella taiwanensis]
MRFVNFQCLQVLLEPKYLTVVGPSPAVDVGELWSAGFSGSTVIVWFSWLWEVTACADTDPCVTVGSRVYLCGEVWL